MLPPAIVSFAGALVLGLLGMSGQAPEAGTLLQLLALGLLMFACLMFIAAKGAEAPR